MDKIYFKKSQNRFWKKFFFFLLTLCVVAVIFFLGFASGRRGNSGFADRVYDLLPKQITNSDKSPSNIKNADSGKPENVDFSLFWEAWNKLKEKSALSPDPKKMLYGSISGLLSSVDDPYTVFFTPEDNKRFKEDIGGEFDGIGVEIEMKDGMPTVVAPLSQTPAEAAGIKAGDIILEVDGTKTSEMGLNETVDKIRGQKGTKVSLKILREAKDQPLDFEVARDTIVVKSVEWEEKNVDGKKFMYVKLRQFGDDTDSLFADFVDKAVAARPDGIIVDLRNNPGGYLETAINLSSYFLDGGTVVLEQDKTGAKKEYKVTKKARLKNIKTAVLVNGGSASASEIFSGALQDRKAGEIIGEKTFGKGSVQELMDLSDGSAVKITVAKWLTPNGRGINGQGISPDIEVKNADNSTDDAQLNKALEYLK